MVLFINVYGTLQYIWFYSVSLVSSTSRTAADLNYKHYDTVASMTVGATARQDAYLISSISTLVASHFNSSFRTIITVYKSVSENVQSL